MRPEIQIDQVLPSFYPRDAIGNEALLMRELLSEAGIPSEIYAENCHKGSAIPVDRLRDVPYRRVLIHHYSVGSNIPNVLWRMGYKSVTRYHNITPPQFFNPQTEWSAYAACWRGYLQAPLVRLVTDRVWADSPLNGSDLERKGFDRIVVLPVLRHYDRILSLEADQSELQRWRASGKKTILFVGRIAPNKAPHDAILYLALLKKFYHKPVRLLWIGAVAGVNLSKALTTLMDQLGLSYAMSGGPSAEDADVVFTGSVSDVHLATYYRLCDVFLCLSDHEGFCVPLVEAMGFGLPIFAHDIPGVTGTLGSGGMVIDKEQPEKTLATLICALEDKALCAELAAKAKQRFTYFSWDALKKSFLELVDELIADKSDTYLPKRYRPRI